MFQSNYNNQISPYNMIEPNQRVKSVPIQGRSSSPKQIYGINGSNLIQNHFASAVKNNK
jgi:hypothetical protein